MAEFLGDIAFMLEVFVLGVGLVILHFSAEKNSNYLKWAGRIMATASVLGILCTSFFYFKYYFAGEFDHAWGMNGMNSQMMPGMEHHNHNHHE